MTQETAKRDSDFSNKGLFFSCAVLSTLNHSKKCTGHAGMCTVRVGM